MESYHEGICEQEDLKNFFNQLEISWNMQAKEAKYHAIKLQEESLKVKHILSKISLLLRSAEQKGNIEDYQALYKKAIEERDEYRMKTHNQACAIVKLERELCKIKNCTLDNKNICSNSASYLDKEMEFLHKENESLRNELKYLKNQLNDQEHLKKELSGCSVENINLKENIVKKQTELMELRCQFDIKLNKLQKEYEQNTLNLQKKLLKCQKELTEAKISKELTENNLEKKYACKVKEMHQELVKIIENNENEQTSIVDCPSNKSESLTKIVKEFTESHGSEQTETTTVIATARSISSTSTITTTKKILNTSYSSEDSAEETGTNRNCKIKLKSGTTVHLLDAEEQLLVKGGERSDEYENGDLPEEETEICTLL